jgi:hypothetical protein
MRVTKASFFCGLFLAITPLQPAAIWAQTKPLCLGSRDIPSPDGALIAHITRVGRGACGESRVEILEADGHLLVTADYSSSDGEQGEGLLVAVWSADSSLLAYSMTNPRQTMSFPVDVYRRSTNKLRPLAQLAPAITVSDPAISFDAANRLQIKGAGGAVTPVALDKP